MINKFSSNNKVSIKEGEITTNLFGEDYVVMYSGEKEVMVKLAELATKNGGDILELGFGLHISADAVQSNPKVTSHTIIEIHPDIYQTALEWAKDKPNTKIIFGDWIDILPTLSKKFDGVLHDTFNDPNKKFFLDYIKPNCKKGTIVAFYEYDGNYNCMNGVRVSLKEEDYQKLPYNNWMGWKVNSYELKYTTFNGTEFIRESEIKNII